MRLYPAFDNDTTQKEVNNAASQATMHALNPAYALAGLPFSYGVFQKYYSQHQPFASDPKDIASIGTTTTGVMYLAAPFVASGLQRWQNRRVLITIVGHVLLLVGLVSASFATKTRDLVITQGLIYGLGGAFMYEPRLFYLDQWFIARKGLAYGILWAGTGLGGTVVPLILDWSLAKYGVRVTFRMWAIVLVSQRSATVGMSILFCSQFILLTPLVFLVKPRLPLPGKGETRPLNLRFLGQWTFWVLELGNIIQGMGYFIPSIYLPTFGETYLDLSSVPNTLLISVFNLASVGGTVLIGYLIDHLHPSTVILISSLGSALSVFVLWGFALSRPVIYIFAIMYGIFAGGYAATWTGYVSEIQRDAIEAEAVIVLGMLSAGRGLGSVSSGPISEALLQYSKWDAPGAYGTQYGVLIVFTGVTAVVGGLGFFTRLRFRGVDNDSIASTMEIRTSHEGTR
ncbi:MAG: hypothetical protein Q9168_002019 [Polycauliona sp. 1 TL-2023]